MQVDDTTVGLINEGKGVQRRRRKEGVKERNGGKKEGERKKVSERE